MIAIAPTATPEFPFDPKQFDAGYYGGQARGGFGEEINWEHPQQQAELQNKFDIIKEDGDFESILFVGCAFGNEVRFFRMRNKEAEGVEISEYAVSKCAEEFKKWVHHYNGWSLGEFKDKSFDIVASFDVLTLMPDEMLRKLAPEMRRVCRHRIVIRTPVDKHADQQGQYVGNDGVTFRCLTTAQWCELFEQDGFKLKRSPDSNNVPSEMYFIFSRA